MRYKAVVFTLLVVCSFIVGKDGYSKTDDMRKRCDECHTMHNSSGGNPMVFGGIGVQPTLLRNNCYGCHTGQNSAGTMPYVMPSGAGAPVYGNGDVVSGSATGTSSTGLINGTLAGGSFYWVSQGQDNMGHNVDVLTVQISRSPPGDPTLIFDGTPGNALTCAGAKGCHGNNAIASEVGSMYRTHHADDSLPQDGSTVARSYRFLDGVVGVEDVDYEWTVDASDHNQYKGNSRSGSDTNSDTSSISHLCADCHGDFHSGAGTAGVDDPDFQTPWLRHPVDLDMNLAAGTGYTNYGGGGAPNYMVETPVASDNMGLGVLSSVVKSPGDAIITCITCHRAHGSPYDSSLRWDYRSWPGGGYNGCGDCHTVID